MEVYAACYVKLMILKKYCELLNYENVVDCSCGLQCLDAVVLAFGRAVYQ